MVAVHLVEAGLLDLDADANDFLPSWKIPKIKYSQARPDRMIPKVTLRGLLSHTAGMNLRGYSGYPPGREIPNLHQILNGEPPANSRPVRMALGEIEEAKEILLEAKTIAEEKEERIFLWQILAMLGDL